jgi:hypothetical protein
MRKGIGVSFILLCLCLPAFSQTPDACGAAVRNLKLSAFLEARPYYLGQTLTPIKFAFSSQGIDVYMVAPPPPGIVAGIQVLLVYQDEALRQHVIRFLRGPTEGVTTTEGIRRPLDNLKFADLIFSCDESPLFPAHGPMIWQGSRKCTVQRILYYEPKQCIILPENPDIYEMQRLSMAGVNHREDIINPMNWLFTLEKADNAALYDDPRFPGGHLLLTRILRAIRAERDDQAKREILR